MTDENDNEPEGRCRACQREIHLGADCLVLEEGVLGPRGFIPLEAPLFFCNEDCLKQHVSPEEVLNRPRRIP